MFRRTGNLAEWHGKTPRERPLTRTNDLTRADLTRSLTEHDLVDVQKAVASRRGVRGFTDDPAPREVLDRVVFACSRRPRAATSSRCARLVLTGAPPRR